MTKVVCDYDTCQGIGMCESLAPDVFELDDDGNLQILVDQIEAGQQESDVEEAVASCPTEALTVVP